MNRFNMNVKALKLVGRESILCAKKIMMVKWAELYDDGMDQIDRDLLIKIASEIYEATCFLMGANDVKFGQLKKSLEHSMNVGRDIYPKTVHDAYEFFINTIKTQESKTDTRRNFARRGNYT